MRGSSLTPGLPLAEVPETFNLTEYFLDRHVAEGRGGQMAVSCDGHAFSYGEILAHVSRAAEGLMRLGVDQGDRIWLLLPDSLEFVVAYFAAMRIGAVAVPCNTTLRMADYSVLLKESRPKALIIHSAFWSAVDNLLGTSAAILVAGERRASCRYWNEWLGAQPPLLTPTCTSRDDDAFWLWTSGSTGAPKAAVHRHADWMYCCEYYARGVLGISPADVTFSSSKLFHAYGLGNSLMFPFSVGASTVLFSGKPQPRAVLEMLRDSRATLFFSVPTLYAAMLQEAEEGLSYDLTSVRLGISAAEPLPAEIYRRWRDRFGFELLDGLGSTEALHIYVSPLPGQVTPGSTGRPVPGYEIRIADEAGLELPQGQIGDLWVRGPSLARRYWNRPELTAERMRNGWFFSGDKYYSDADGNLWYAGRSDDMFRVSGEWVSPFEVESALVAHPAVLEAAVVPFENEHKLLQPKACVVLKDGWPPDDVLATELQQWVRQRLTGYKYPRQIEFWKDLPKTATGKIQRYKLR